MAYFLLPTLFTTFHALVPLAHISGQATTCRSFCGNLTVGYPFTLRSGCGHPGFRDLLFCINDILMLHIRSGSYRVLDIDYAYDSLVLHDPHMSTCDSLVLGNRGNGFVVEPWRAPYLSPTPDNVFMLLGCSARSPLFQGFPGKHSPCGNVSGLGCEEYYRCPAWDAIGPRREGPVYGSGPPHCCAMPYGTVRSMNLSRLDCQGYSSAYSVAPLKMSGPGQWAYGIQVKYYVHGSDSFCRACEATIAQDIARDLELPLSSHFLRTQHSPSPGFHFITLPPAASILVYSFLELLYDPLIALWILDHVLELPLNHHNWKLQCMLDKL